MTPRALALSRNEFRWATGTCGAVEPRAARYAPRAAPPSTAVVMMIATTRYGTVTTQDASARSAAQAVASQIEIVRLDPGRGQVSLDAAVAPLQLLEDADDRRGRRSREATNLVALGLRLRLREERLLARSQPLLAQCVIGCDLRDVDPGEVQEQRGEQAGAILAADAVHDNSAFARTCHCTYRGSHVVLEVLEEDR